MKHSPFDLGKYYLNTHPNGKLFMKWILEYKIVDGDFNNNFPI